MCFEESCIRLKFSISAGQTHRMNLDCRPNCWTSKVLKDPDTTFWLCHVPDLTELPQCALIVSEKRGSTGHPNTLTHPAIIRPWVGGLGSA